MGSGGTCARVVEDGTISVGDEVEVLQPAGVYMAMGSGQGVGALRHRRISVAVPSRITGRAGRLRLWATLLALRRCGPSRDAPYRFRPPLCYRPEPRTPYAQPAYDAANSSIWRYSTPFRDARRSVAVQPMFAHRSNLLSLRSVRSSRARGRALTSPVQPPPPAALVRTQR
jgi:hypothetical protein